MIRKKSFAYSSLYNHFTTIFGMVLYANSSSRVYGIIDESQTNLKLWLTLQIYEGAGLSTREKKNQYQFKIDFSSQGKTNFCTFDFVLTGAINE